MNIPFYEQETDWTCGPASMRMVLDALGIKKSEKQLIKLLRTNKQVGTWNESFPCLAEKYKLNYVAERNSTLSSLRNYLRKGYLLIVSYYLPKDKVSHYSVVKKISRGFIYFLDPFQGPSHKYKINQFIKLWNKKSEHDEERRWFIGIKN